MFDHSSMMFPETAHFSGRVVHKNKPYEAARDTHFGKVYWKDKYVTFDGYHWLKTANEIPYEDEGQEILSYWITEEIERR